MRTRTRYYNGEVKSAGEWVKALVTTTGMKDGWAMCRHEDGSKGIKAPGNWRYLPASDSDTEVRMNDLDEEMYSLESPLRPDELFEIACVKRRTRLTLAEVAEAIANASDKNLSEVLSLYCEDERLLLGGVIVDIIDDYLRGVVNFERRES